MIEKEKWLKERMGGIGGSDASVVLGLNPWKSRLELWHEKVEGIMVDKEENNADLKWGKLLENIICEEYQRETGRIVIKSPDQIRSKDYPFMTANLDSIITNVTELGLGVLEIKTKGAFVSWDDNIPSYYITQMQHYLAVTGYKWGAFCIFDLGKKELIKVDVERDNKFIEYLISEEGKFWKLVESKDKNGLKVDSSGACNEFLRKLYPNEIKGEIIDIKNNLDAFNWAMKLKDVNIQLKKLEEDERGLKNCLMDIVGNAEKAVGNGFSITWKRPKNKSVFDIKKFKEEHFELYNKYVDMKEQTRRFMIRYQNHE